MEEACAGAQVSGYPVNQALNDNDRFLTLLIPRSKKKSNMAFGLERLTVTSPSHLGFNSTVEGSSQTGFATTGLMV